VGKEPDNDRYDPRIIRHLYDLSYLSPEIINNPNWSKLSLETIAHDLKTRDKSLASKIDSPQELLSQLVNRLNSNPLYRQHYREFVENFAYGESLSFDDAKDSLVGLTKCLTENFESIKNSKPIDYGNDLMILDPNWQEDTDSIEEGCELD
jgi:Nucleotidyl transferase AbiEii toxin, Type IV TA system